MESNPNIDITLIATDKCNMKCVYCYNALNKSQHISLENAKIIADKLAVKFATSKIRWAFHGGEPTLLGYQFYRDIFSYLRICFPNLVELKLHTNGTLWTEKMIDICVGHNVSLAISLDGAEQDNKYRVFKDGRQTFTKVTDLIRRLDDLKYDNYYIICTLTSLNVNSLVKIYEFLKSIGVKRLALNFLNSQSCLNDFVPFKGSISELSAAIFDLTKHFLADENPMSIIYPINMILRALLTKEEKSRLSCQKRTMTIRPNGDMIPCVAFAGNGHKFIYGNIFHDGLEYCLAHPMRQNLILKYENYPKTCGSCEYKYICVNDCPLLAFLGGDIWKIPGKCDYSFFKIIHHALNEFVANSK